MENGPLVQSPPANGARRGRSDLRSDRWSGEKEGGKATGYGTRGGEGGGRRGYKRRFAVLLDGIDGRQRVRRRRKLRSVNVLWWASIRRRKKSPTRNHAARVCASPLRSLEINAPQHLPLYYWTCLWGHFLLQSQHGLVSKTASSWVRYVGFSRAAAPPHFDRASQVVMG